MFRAHHFKIEINTLPDRLLLRDLENDAALKANIAIRFRCEQVGAGQKVGDSLIPVFGVSCSEV